MKIQRRLDFKDIFEESERQTIEECLKNISNDKLIKTIGFFATKDIHWSNFFLILKNNIRLMKRYRS